MVLGVVLLAQSLPSREPVHIVNRTYAGQCVSRARLTQHVVHLCSNASHPQHFELRVHVILLDLVRGALHVNQQLVRVTARRTSEGPIVIFRRRAFQGRKLQVPQTKDLRTVKTRQPRT